MTDVRSEPGIDRIASARPALLRVAAWDDVAIALRPLERHERVLIDGHEIEIGEAIAPGHKVALRVFGPGEAVTKYGGTIGVTCESIQPGAWVHSHNLRTGLSGIGMYSFRPEAFCDVRTAAPASSVEAMPTFLGYRRRDGRVGTRNEIWVLNTVACVNHAAERIARGAAERLSGRVDGVHAFAHPYGCSQLGDDLQNTQRVLAGLLRHPNAGGVLVLGLGCENNQLETLLAMAGDVDRDRIAFFNSQDVSDELAEGHQLLDTLVERVAADRRVACPASALVLGHKCGGSDAFSGITANPLLGRIADRLTGMGGTVLLTEVPEMFGAEQELMNRASNEAVFEEIVALINDFKAYFIRHGQPVSENPSPGNRAGGLTTLEEKSWGAVQKGGHSTITQVLRYGEQIHGPGLALLESPGNDGVSSTAMVASGATLLLFSTGRGTPLGFPVPTLKISSNTDIAQRKPHWVDFNAGGLLDGSATMPGLENDLMSLVLAVASGETLARNEVNGYREIAIWKEGVTL